MLLMTRKTPATLLRAGLMFFAVAAMVRILAHPATDFGRGFVEGFTGTAFCAAVLFLGAGFWRQRHA
jgi:hypothetical protein